MDTEKKERETPRNWSYFASSVLETVRDYALVKLGRIEDLVKEEERKFQIAQSYLITDEQKESAKLVHDENIRNIRAKEKTAAEKFNSEETLIGLAQAALNHQMFVLLDPEEKKKFSETGIFPIKG